MNNKNEILLQEISKEFSLTSIDSGNVKFKEIYPFCNEFGFPEIIKNLRQIEAKCANKTKVSLLFGESNFISLLPTLSEISDLVLIADINPDQHEHIKFILDCFKSADSPNAFLNNYFNNNPLIDKQIAHKNERYGIEKIKEQIYYSKDSTGKYSFLNSQSNYDKCKNSLNSVELLQIHLDLSDEHACKKINSLLTEHNALFTLCNFTNIHNYVEPGVLQRSVRQLLKDNEQVLIMYSTGHLTKLRACITTELNTYLTIDNKSYGYNFDIFLQEMEYKKNMMSTFITGNEFFSKRAKSKCIDRTQDISYFALACSEDELREIIDGKSNVNSHSTLLHAYDTIEEVEKFVADKKAANTIKKGIISLFPFEADDYWIFKMRANKNKINYLLEYLPERNTARNEHHHKPSNMHMAQIKLPHLILEVINYKRTVKILNEPNVDEQHSSLDRSGFTA